MDAGASPLTGGCLCGAVRYEIADHWHIYWQNSGESGQPPRITWKLPDGFSAGNLRYPVPTRHSDAGGFITTNILSGDPSLLVSIAPSRAVGSDATRLAQRSTPLRP